MSALGWSVALLVLALVARLTGSDALAWILLVGAAYALGRSES